MTDATGAALPTPSLRVRKRLAAMRRIQSVALDLFEQQGFDQVTIERIAHVAEVSPSSVYRWFGTKEALVIWDEFDPAALAGLRERLATAPPMDALREVVQLTVGSAMDDTERVHRRLRLAFANPSVEAASILQAHEMAELIASIIARGSPDDLDDLELQVMAHAFVGALVGALRHYEASDFTTPIDEIIERPLELLRQRRTISG